MRAGIVGGHWRGALLGLAALATSSQSRAAEVRLAAPSVCNVGDELSFRAERALGQPIEAAAAVRCTIHIRRESAEYAARLEVQSIGSPQPSRSRSFSAPSCEKLTDTLALAVSLAIASGASGPTAAAGAAAPTPLAETPPPAAPVQDPDRVDAPSPPARVRTASGLNFGASAALVADAGTLPGAGIGASLGMSVGLSAFDMRLLGTYLPPRGASIGAAEPRSPGAEIELLAGSVLACAPRLLGAPPLAIGACAGAEMGRLEGTGTGLAVARSGGSWWSAARADAMARWALGAGFGLGLQLSALIPWDRDEFAVQGVGRVFRPWRVTSRATLGLSYEIGSAPQ